MTEKPAQSSVQLTDPRALRAYAHPTRMALSGLLRREGPLTATRAAQLTGESVASCSYHLRVLAKYGLVEEADPEGPGREKPWRATAQFTDWPGYSEDPAVAAAAEALTAAVAENYFHRMARAQDARRELPRAWQEAEVFTDTTLYLTAEELSALGKRMAGLLAEFADRDADPALRPEGARRVPWLQIAFVEPDPAEPASPADPAGPTDGAGAGTESGEPS